MPTWTHLPGIALTAGLAVTRLFAVEPITRVADLLRLSAEEAAGRIPVQLDATLVFCDFTRATYFIHDGSAACRVVIAKEQGRPLLLNDRLELRGVSRPGGYLTDMIAESVRVIGRSESPAPRLLENDQIFAPDACAQWVAIEGRLRGTHGTDTGLALDVQVQGWVIPAMLPGDAKVTTPPWGLLQRRVRVTGIAGTFFNQERQMTGRYLHVPSLAHVEALSDPRPNEGAIDARVVDLMRPNADPDQRVRVRGEVLHQWPGEGLFLRDETGAMQIRTAQPVDLRPGDRVEAVGLPQLEPFRPSLRATEVRALATGTPPTPQPFDPKGRRRTLEQHSLVRLSARVLAVSDAPEALRLQCQAEGKLFEAYLPQPPGTGAMPGLEPGARVEITGLCQLQSTRFLFLPEYIDGFRLWLRSPDDLRVTARPPWWTPERLLWLVGALVLCASAAGAWAVLLRWRVAAQTAVIHGQVARKTLLEERARIARDWHDTMEQQLMGVSMLVEDAAARPDCGAGAEERLRLARRMIRHCREESRASIRDLRSVALENGGLASACEKLLAPLATAAGATFALEVHGQRRRLPRAGEHHVLRLLQEAVANAAKHARATTIRVRLDYEVTGLRVAVEDDGIGFDATQAPVDGTHLGLSAMHERARRLDARLGIGPRPGGGTRVTLFWPNPGTPPDNKARTRGAGGVA